MIQSWSSYSYFIRVNIYVHVLECVPYCSLCIIMFKPMYLIIYSNKVILYLESHLHACSMASYYSNISTFDGLCGFTRSLCMDHLIVGVGVISLFKIFWLTKFEKEITWKMKIKKIILLWIMAHLPRCKSPINN